MERSVNVIADARAFSTLGRNDVVPGNGFQPKPK